MLKNYTLNRLLVLVATAGFAFLIADTTIEHWEIFSKDVWAYVPVLFSVLGVIAGAVAVVRWNDRWIRFFQVFLIASCIVAAAGVYFHIAEDDDEKEAPALQEQAEKKQEKDKPPLAPLAFGGLAVVGLLGTARKWPAEVVEPKK